MKFVLVGPVYPYHGGIAHHITMRSLQITQENQQITLPIPEEIP